MIPNIHMPGHKHDHKARKCHDCKHMYGAISWWCENETAVKERNTAIPGIRGCPHWEPCLVWFGPVVRLIDKIRRKK